MTTGGAAHSHEGILDRVLFAGGGTGGHIYMAVAIRAELRKACPAAECRFVGTEHGLERRILAPLDFPLDTIRIGGLRGVPWSRKLRTLLQLPGSLRTAWKLIGELRPAIVVGLGGYSSGPVVVAAKLRQVPAIVIEPNVVPGFTNRRLARWIDGAAVSFEETAADLGPRARRTGIPVRAEFHAIPPKDSSEGPLQLLVFGGSRGSRPLNRLFCETLPFLDPSRFRVRHQTGANDLERVKQCYRQHQFSAQISEYIEDMPAQFCKAGLIISRAGASTVAEITAAGRAAILIPFPQAADDHQRRNALALQHRGAALVAEQLETSGRQLAQMIAHLEQQRSLLAEMSRAAKRMAQPNSAAQIVALMQEVRADRR